MLEVLKNGRSSQYQAFTLAEVLIVLAIIGVIAAMVIPSLITKTQNQEYVTALKKAYSETNQALKLMANDYGCPDDLKCTGLFAPDVTDEATLGEAFVKYFHVAKNCKTEMNEGCWPQETNLNYDSSSESNSTTDSETVYKFVTADGMSFFIQNMSNNCSSNWSSGRTGNLVQTCGFLSIDVNGLKKPNAEGRDTFTFYISNGKGALIYPRGGADDSYFGTDYWWRDNSGGLRRCYPDSKRGDWCAGRIMEEGWQMNY